MGFADSFKTGLAAIGDFIGATAPTVIPILQQTGVLPYPTAPVAGRGPGTLPPRPRYMPGGAPSPYPFPAQAPFSSANVPYAQVPSYPTGVPAMGPYAPGGVMPAFQATRAGFTQAGLDLPLIDVPIVPQGAGAGLQRLTSPFVPTMAGARAQAFVAANPMTGALTWFKPAGRPILWSGDLTACHRVGRIASRARRATRKR